MTVPVRIQARSAKNNGSSETLTIGDLAAPVAGNLVVVGGGIDQAGVYDDTVADLDQYTPLTPLVTASNLESQVFWKVAGAGEAEQVILVNARGDAQAGAAIEIAGQHPTTPIQNVFPAAGNGDVIAPPQYTATGDAKVLMWVWLDRRVITTTQLTGWTLVQSRDQGAIHCQLWERDVSGGETATPGNLAANVAEDWQVHIVVIASETISGETTDVEGGFGAFGETAFGERRSDLPFPGTQERWEQVARDRVPGNAELVIAARLAIRRKDV